jgi:hypothetical protein
MTPAQDYDAIMAAIRHYVDGAHTGSSDEMKKAFHDQATIFGYIGPDLFAGPIQGLFDWHNGNGAAKDVAIRVVSVNQEESVATARLEIDNWTGHRFTDMFALLKVDGEWKVMCKVFHLHE